MTPRRSRYDDARARVDRVESVAAQETRVNARVLIEGSGESLVEIVFPVTFGEQPFGPYIGAALVAGDSAKEQFYPQATGVVVQWRTFSRGISEQDFYTGATVAIRTDGKLDQKMWVSIKFEGVALTNPVDRGAP